MKKNEKNDFRNNFLSENSCGKNILENLDNEDKPILVDNSTESFTSEDVRFWHG